jgi:hypothetical protein
MADVDGHATGLGLGLSGASDHTVALLRTDISELTVKVATNSAILERIDETLVRIARLLEERLTAASLRTSHSVGARAIRQHPDPRPPSGGSEQRRGRATRPRSSPGGRSPALDARPAGRRQRWPATPAPSRSLPPPVHELIELLTREEYLTNGLPVQLALYPRQCHEGALSLSVRTWR